MNIFEFSEMKIVCNTYHLIKKWLNTYAKHKRHRMYVYSRCQMSVRNMLTIVTI